MVEGPGSLAPHGRVDPLPGVTWSCGPRPASKLSHEPGRGDAWEIGRPDRETREAAAQGSWRRNVAVKPSSGRAGHSFGNATPGAGGSPIGVYQPPISRVMR
jgi:hypothetical protein